MICSVCGNDINGHYCSNCGQYFKNERLTGISILGDLFDNIFSLEKSFYRNISIGLSEPSKIVVNYWKGFRKFYYSPGKFFTLASLFLLLHYLIANDFLGVEVSSTISSQFVILFLNIVLLTILSTILYIKYKRNFFEHLILNIYNVSIWTIAFVPISILINLTINDNHIEEFFFLPYHLLIVIWNSKAFELATLKRFFYVVVNLVLFYGTILFLIYWFGGF
jgi:hypothetical protein